MFYFLERTQSVKTDPYLTQMLELVDKDFKVVTITILTDIRENVLEIN